MKILIYQPRVSYFLGGGEVYPLQNARFFAKLGHNVTILTTRAPFLKECDYFIDFVKNNKDVKIEYLDLDDNFKDIYDEPAGINWRRWDRECLWVARLGYEYIRKHKFDVVCVHAVIDALAVPFNQKHVLHLHGSPLEINYICELILEKEKNLIAVSNKVANKWIEFGAHPEIKICTNAIDDSVFFPDPTVEKDTDLVFVGRLIPIKGVQHILEALKILKDNYNLHLTFSVVGDGPYKEQLEKLTEQWGLEKQVTFHGTVSQEQLIKAYRSAKIAVLPSFDKEGIMSTLLEAVSCGTPAITTKGTSMEEFAKNNENALLVEPESATDLSDKIYQLLTDKKLASRLRENGLKAVKEQYLWLAKAKQLINLYEEF